MKQPYDLKLIRPYYEKTAFEENIDYIRTYREAIIRSYECTQISPELEFGRQQARKAVLELHDNAGIKIGELQDLVYIDHKSIPKINEKLVRYGGRVRNNVYGFNSVLNGVSFVVLYPGISNLDYAGMTFHEIFHSAGENVLTVEGDTINYGRIGFETFGEKASHQSWLLEEGLAYFEERRFKTHLGKHQYFEKDRLLWQEKVEKRDRVGGMFNRKVKLENGAELEPEYFYCAPVNGNVGHLELTHSPEAISGSFIEMLVNKFPDSQKQGLLNLFYATRRELELVPLLAKVIDSKLGKGTYSKLLRCPRTEEDVWELIKEYRTTSAGNVPSIKPF